MYPFAQADGSRTDLLGGKGAQLAEMTSLGLPVPPGFTITTEACREYFSSGKRLPAGLWDQVLEAMKDLEATTGRGFGDPASPLLVSVRSGAAVSMPGMMDTILNLGINGDIAEGIARQAGDPSFGLDLQRRFIQMFGSVALGIDEAEFDRVLDEQRQRAGVTRTAPLDPDSLRLVIGELVNKVEQRDGLSVPNDPYAQLEAAIGAVFESWNTRRAVDYRNFHKIPHDLGTAVNVMAMVYGNADDESCTGVLFTRNPSTGEKKIYGEYLVNAQGEEVVAGQATPRGIAQMATEMSGVYRQVIEFADRLERHYREVQDIEFTVERGKPYVLQTRAAKLGAKATVKVAVDMAREGVISKEEALNRVDPEQVYRLLLPKLDNRAEQEARDQGRLLAVGLGASPGGATGKTVFSAGAAVRLAAQGVDVILVRPETRAEDVHGMLSAAGTLTSRGGGTSHAAVVARGLGKPCVTGTESIEVIQDEGLFKCGDLTVREGDEISIDGASGEVFLGRVTTIQPRVSDETEMVALLKWADVHRRLGVWANADNGPDAAMAREFGAEGIGLCRTEHMFFEPERLGLMQQMILAAHSSGQNPDAPELRDKYLASLEPLQEFQVHDFEAIFRAMDGLPVVIRLLDPPLHEFLPRYDDLFTEVVELRAKDKSSPETVEKEDLLTAVADMREFNPMMGLRGCRLGLLYPAIYDMQVRAILTAAANVAGEGVIAKPEIMIPFVADGNEMRLSRQHLEEEAERFHKETGKRVVYKIGTMIETPRAALTAGEIAGEAEFFSFGTNDLTQTTFGFSRDDAEGKFLMRYVEDQVLPDDPFQVVDRAGVGRLVQIACESGRRARPDLELGVCGEHGGDPASIEFFDSVGLAYVSCSPYRVPVARLAAARSAMRHLGSDAPARQSHLASLAAFATAWNACCAKTRTSSGGGMA